MGEGYRRIIQDYDSEASLSRQREREEAETQTVEVARGQAAVEAWFGTVFRPELAAANEAIRELKASILITNPLSNSAAKPVTGSNSGGKAG